MSLKRSKSEVPAPSSSDDDGNKQQQQQQQQHSVKSKSKIKDPQPALTNDSDDSESDSDASPEAPIPPRRPTRGADPSIKPIASKPMDGTPGPKHKKAAADSDTTAVAPKPTPEMGKRKLEFPEEENDILSDGPSGKKRVWSDEDEITVLEGMIEYQSEYGSYPSTPAGFDSFHDFIKKSLQIEFTKTQIYDKILRLRKKYSANSGRSKKGAGVSFSKDHEQMIYDLSNKIWGSKKAAIENGNANKEEVEPTKVSHLSPRKKSRNDSATPRVTLAEGPTIMGGEIELSAEFLYPTLDKIVTQLEIEHAKSTMHGAFKRALNSINPLKGKELEKKWARQSIAEMQLFMRREELRKELTGALIEVLKNGS